TREELGLTVERVELVQAGWRREEVFYPNGLIEREVQDIFFLLRAVELADMRPDPSEVSGVVLIPASVLRRLASGSLSDATVPGGAVGSDGRVDEGAVPLHANELVPRSGDYYAKAARYARALARGATVV